MAGGVTAVQLSAMALDDDVVAVKPAGAAGTAVQLAPPPVTVSLALLLVTDPPALVTTTLKSAPLSLETVAGVVYVAAVAPVMALPFFDH